MLSGGRKTQRPDRRGRVASAGPRARHRRAFTLLELHISMFVLMTGLLSMVYLVTVQGKQMARSESWCRGSPTYHVVSQTNPWMRKLNAAARLETEAGQEPWTPPVAGAQEYQLQVDVLSEDTDQRTITVNAVLQSVGG